MKRETFADVVELSGVSYGINNGGGKHSCYVEILRAIHDQLEAMLSYHGKVLVLRLDLHLDGFSSDNHELSRFIEKIKRRYQEHYRGKRMGYVWVRELERAKQQHYHLALYLDANKIQHPAKLINWIEQRWQSRGHPKPFTPKSCFSVINRKNDCGKQVVFKRLSYLAKTRGKGYRDENVNDYSSSRIKAKDK
ncbi:MAG: hypothetical protein CMK46_00760 [Porticoccus sp.]|nr:hypothetical protein [Porticoccus sp.]|tara:strand:- start:5220 stop:5798 length:579 start_codon:yes stop_codon:yes gene_type:complete